MMLLLNNLWMACMVASLVLKGLPPVFPHAANSLGALGDIAFGLACLFANPTGAMTALKGMASSRWSGPAEVKT